MRGRQFVVVLNGARHLKNVKGVGRISPGTIVHHKINQKTESFNNLKTTPLPIPPIARVVQHSLILKELVIDVRE